MSNKEELRAFEATTCVQAAWFGRAVRDGRWAKAGAIVGGLAASLGSLANAEEARGHEMVAEEARRAGLMLDEIALHVADKAQGAAIDAYAAFLSYLPEAHARLGALVGDDPGTRGTDKKVLLDMVAGRAVNVLGLG